MRLATKLQIIAWNNGGKLLRWITQQMRGVVLRDRRQECVQAAGGRIGAAGPGSVGARTYIQKTLYLEMDACLISWDRAVRSRSTPNRGGSFKYESDGRNTRIG